MNKDQQHTDKVSEEAASDIVERVVQTPDLLERVLKTPQASGVLAMKVRRTHSGPLPTSNEIKEYNKVIPNGADCIMQLAEREQKGRLSHRGWALFIRGMGLVFALISVVLVTGICFLLIQEEQYELATQIMIGVLVALAAVFVIGRFFPSKNNKESSENED